MTLPEFAEAAALAVEAAGVAPESRQAKSVPASRMVRYYTSRGLLPRPGTRGRALVYGRRHLLQLVAIKRLQAEGHSLDQIADRLTGVTDRELARLAAIPPGAIPARLGDVESEPESRPSRRAGRFWDGADGAAGEPAVPPVDSPAVQPIVQPVTEIRLTDSITILVAGPAAGLPSAADIATAAGPLVRLLDLSDRKEIR